MSNTTYSELGVIPVINAAGALSRLGGSLLSAGVRKAMNDAGQHFIDLPTFHERVGEELARITRNEAACVSSGAAAGVLVAVAACIAGDDVQRAEKLPDPSAVIKSDVVVWSEHLVGKLAGADQVLSNGYLSAVGMAGAELRSITGPDEISPDTACMLWFPRVYPEIENEEEQFERFTSRAHALNVPMIVDAADQVPPVSNLWYYTKERSADLAIFSGGKGLLGPGASGLIVGRKDLIRACRVNSGPEHSVGRPAKVGKEELAGLLQAVREAVAADPVLQLKTWMETVEFWINCLRQLEARGVTSYMSPTSHSGQPIPRAIVRMHGISTATRDMIIARLWEGSPCISVLPEENGAIALNPQMVKKEEIKVVSEKVLDAINAHL
jgi:uncharacterized pyridoxal phosphate-dependent enzyme